MSMNWLQDKSWLRGSCGLLLLVLITLCVSSALAQPHTAQEPPLRHTEALDVIIADLESYIPARMDSAGVPGLALALVREGQVAYAAGFGIANRITRRPVTAETVFEVASNSKVVTTYTALRLVDQGRLTLDEPLAAVLTTPWLPPSSYADQITLRHVASHSAGFSDNLLPLDKSVMFEPGSAFAYSGVGFLYLQEAVEQVAQASLEDAARRLVFEPLGMTVSSFINRADITPRMANGHMGYTFPVMSFLVPFGVSLLLVMFIVAVVGRLRGKRPFSRKPVIGSVVIAAVLTLGGIGGTLGRMLPNLALMVVLSGLAFTIAFALFLVLGGKMTARMPPARRRWVRMLWGALGMMMLAWFTSMLAGPLPRGPSPPPSAVGSLRTSAPDLAAFLAEVAAPQLVNAEIATQLHTPQIAISDDFSWGLGIGVQHSDQGDALWQNGMTFGFRSVMVIYPEHRWGIVVLTNSNDGLPVAYDVAARALGGKAQWFFF